MAGTPGAGFSLIATKAVSVHDMPIKWFWPKYVPAAGAILVDGDSGVGKSRVTANWLLYADGQAWLPDGSVSDVPVKGIIYLTGEMDERQLGDVFEMQGWTRAELEQRLRRVYSVSGPGNVEHVFSLDSRDHLAALEKMCKDFDANVVVLDPFIEFFAGDENSTHTARAYVRKVQDLGLRLGILFILIHHWNKNEELSTRNRMSGSHQLTATVRARISLFPLKGSEKRKVFRLEKKIEEDQPDLGFEIDDFGEIQWYPDTKPIQSVSSAVNWVRGYLGDKQSHDTPEVKSEFMAAGFPLWMLKKALDKIRDEVNTEPSYYGGVRKRAWRLK